MIAATRSRSASAPRDGCASCDRAARPCRRPAARPAPPRRRRPARCRAAAGRRPRAASAPARAPSPTAAAARAAAAARRGAGSADGSGRRVRRAAGSRTTPPPSVPGGEIERTTKRSPARAISGRSQRSCQRPGSRSAMRAGVSRVPWWICTRRGTLGVAELERDVEDPRGLQPRVLARDDVSRPIASTRTPARFTATRCPALARSTAASCTWALRTLARRPDGSKVTRSPAPSEPDHSVPGDHGAGAVDRERAIDVEHGRPVVRRAHRGTRRGDMRDRGADLLDAGAGAGGAVDDRHVLVDQRARLAARARAGVGEVGLRHRHDARAHAERAQHGRVLDRLRHHPVVGGHDEQEQVHAGRSGDHRAHEALVARDVDEREQPARRRRAGRSRGRSTCREPAPPAAGRCRAR